MCLQSFRTAYPSHLQGSRVKCLSLKVGTEGLSCNVGNVNRNQHMLRRTRKSKDLIYTQWKPEILQLSPDFEQLTTLHFLRNIHDYSSRSKCFKLSKDTRMSYIFISVKSFRHSMCFCKCLKKSYFAQCYMTTKILRVLLLQVK
jgi:hypothetical protein